MSTSLLYHAFGIRGYQYTRSDSHGGQVIFSIRQQPNTCRCEIGIGEIRVRSHFRPSRLRAARESARR